MALLTIGLYVVTARLGLEWALPPEKKATPVWLPSGIALTAILTGGFRLWPAVWLGAFSANAWDVFASRTEISWGTHLSVAAGIAMGSTLQAVVGALALRRWIGSGGIFEGARNTFRFAGLTLAACLIAATVGVATLLATGLTSWVKAPITWWTWWVGDTIGIFIITPLVLSRRERAWFSWDTQHVIELVVLTTLLVGTSLFVFGGWRLWGIVTGTLTYFTVPLLVWATFRFGPRGATVSLLLLSQIAVWGTAHRHGPFIQTTLTDSLLLVQTFVGVLAVTTLALAAVLTERRHAERSRLEAIQELERALHEIKTLRGLIPICAWCKKIRNDAGSWEQLEAYLRQHTQAQFSHGICPDCLEARHGITEPTAQPET